jgi:hypothetical protein
MTHRLVALSSIAWTAALAVVLASACGGNSFSSHDDPQGGTSNGGTTSTGATSSVAGKPSKGGTSSGGSVGSAGAAATAGTASGGAAGSSACTATPDAGNCDAYIERWYHDPTTGLCRGFIYGGCGGNDNNYQSFEECQKACPGGSPNYDECSKPTDCMVTGGGCCGICDGPGVQARDLLAYNKKYAGLLIGCGSDTAPTPDPGSGAAPPGDIACAPCPPLMGDEGTLKYFVPNCVRGECVVEDIRSSAVSLCKTDQDCTLRNGNGCCESCGEQRAIAVSTNGSFSKLVCGDFLPPCAACEAQPGNVAALCGADQHCQVVPLLK